MVNPNNALPFCIPSYPKSGAPVSSTKAELAVFDPGRQEHNKRFFQSLIDSPNTGNEKLKGYQSLTNFKDLLQNSKVV